MRIEAEPETREQASRLRSPRLIVRTDLGPFKAMEEALLALGRGGFDTVMWFNGGVEDPTPETKEGMRTSAIVKAMVGLERPRVPLMGLKAVLKYRRISGVKATVKVGRSSHARVRLRVRGAIYRGDWHAVRTLAKGREGRATKG